MTNRSSQASGPSPGCIDHLRYLFPTMNNPIFLLSPEFSSSMPSRIPPWSYPYLEMSQHLRIQPPHAQQIVFSEDGLTNVFIHPTCSSYKTWLACLPLRSGVSVPSLGVWTRRLPRSVEIGRVRLCDFWDKVIEWIQLLHRLSLPFSLPVPPSPFLSFSLSALAFRSHSLFLQEAQASWRGHVYVFQSTAPLP